MKKLNLSSKAIDKIIEDLTPLIIKLYYHDDLICHCCLRSVPNKKHFTKNGCIWCDAKWHRRKG